MHCGLQVRLGPGSELFAFLASCIQQFLAEQPELQTLPNIPLGFTFSFPTQQLSLNSATLATWTKVNRQSSILLEPTNCFSY